MACLFSYLCCSILLSDSFKRRQCSVVLLSHAFARSEHDDLTHPHCREKSNTPDQAEAASTKRVGTHVLKRKDQRKAIRMVERNEERGQQDQVAAPIPKTHENGAGYHQNL